MVAFLGCYLVPIHASKANHATGPTCSPRNHMLATQPAPLTAGRSHLGHNLFVYPRGYERSCHSADCEDFVPPEIRG
jgi:hypothetical protein